MKFYRIIVVILILTPPILGVAFFLAGFNDIIHVFPDEEKVVHVVLSSSFQSSLLTSILIATIAIGISFLAALYIYKLRSGKRNSNSADIVASTFLPLSLGLFVPLRYLDGIADFSSATFLFSSTLMPLLMFIAALICGHLYLSKLKSKTESIQQSEFLERFTNKTIGWLIFISLALVFSIITPFYLENSVFDGDQPHYLIVTHSLAEDGDIYIEDDHEAEVWRDFTPIKIHPQYFVRTTDKQIIPFHRIGLPILTVIPYWLAGKLGVIILNALMAALAAANLYWLIMKIIPDRRAALIATAWSTLTIPVLSLTFMFFTEVAALCFTLISINLILQKKEHDFPRLYWIIPFAIWSLPWFHARDMITAIALSAFLVVRTRKRPVIAISLALICLILAMGIPVYNYYFYGTFSPVAEMGPDQEFAFNFGNIINGIGGLLFDQEFGILLYNPALIFAFVGLLPLFRRRPAITIWLIIIIGFSVGPNILYRMWWGGGSPPGRYYVAIFHLAAIPVAAFLNERLFDKIKPVFRILMIYAIAIAIALLVNNHLLVNHRDGTSLALTSVSAAQFDAVEWWPTWIVEGSRSWPLAGLMMLWLVVTIAAFTMAKRFISPLIRHKRLLPSFCILFSMLFFICSMILYTNVAESITEGEPNGNLPQSHELNAEYLRRWRLDSYDFSAISPRKESAFPAVGFSAEVLFGKESLLADDQAARGRSKLVTSEKISIPLVGPTYLWAGDYKLVLGIHSQSGNADFQISLKNPNDTSTARPIAEKQILTGETLETKTIPFVISENSRGVKLEISSSAPARFVYAEIRPVSLLNVSDIYSPREYFEYLHWQLKNIEILVKNDIILSANGNSCWISGDVAEKLILVKDHPVNSIQLNIFSRSGVSVNLKNNSGSFEKSFMGEQETQSVTLPTELIYEINGLYYYVLNVEIKGGYIPAEVSRESKDKRYLGMRVTFKTSDNK